jgi:hypothetical protein
MRREIIGIYQIKIIRDYRQHNALIDNYVTSQVHVFDVLIPSSG